MGAITGLSITNHLLAVEIMNCKARLELNALNDGLKLETTGRAQLSAPPLHRPPPRSSKPLEWILSSKVIFHSSLDLFTACLSWILLLLLLFLFFFFVYLFILFLFFIFLRFLFFGGDARLAFGFFSIQLKVLRTAFTRFQDDFVVFNRFCHCYPIGGLLTWQYLW